MTKDGRLGNLLEVWTPWWNKPNLVAELDNANPFSQPIVWSDIPNFSTLLKTRPSVEVKYSVVNILYCYVFVSRLHNGDHVAMATESVSDFLELSVVMGQGQSCGSVEEAIQSCLRNFIRPNNNFETTPEWNFLMIKDIEIIISQKTSTENLLHTVLCALSDVYYMFKAAYKETVKCLKIEKSDKKKSNLMEQKRKLYLCVKKCEFFLSWSQSYGMALIGVLPEIQMVYALLASEYQSVTESKNTLESEWGGHIKPRKKKLVQEV